MQDRKVRYSPTSGNNLKMKPENEAEMTSSTLLARVSNNSDGIVRDWTYEIVETLATVNTPPVYSF